jgi:hypothetical protein
MSNGKFLALMAALAATVIALLLGLGYCSGWESDGDVECVAIGSNPCVPVSK